MKPPKQSDYPKELTLSGETYRIIFVDGLTDYGYCDSGTKEIFIRAGMRPSTTLKTFIHECIHMIEFVEEFEMPHKQVYLLENAIYNLLVKNL